MAPEAMDLEAAWHNFDGNRELLAEAIDIYFTEVPAMVAEVGEACQARDLARVERASHRLRGALALFCASEAVATARQLEELALEGDESGTLRAHADLGRALANLNRTLAGLRQELLAAPPGAPFPRR